MWRIPLILLLCLSCHAATTNTAAGVDINSVSNALVLCAAGDTVAIPAGAANWAQTLWVKTAVSIIGAGTNSTIITNSSTGGAWLDLGAGNPPLVQFSLTNGGWCRFSGVQVQANSKTGIRIHGTGGKVTYFRIDHCQFISPNVAILWCDGSLGGPFNGLMDNCYATNYGMVLNSYQWSGYNWTNTSPPFWGIGSTNGVIIESCVFTNQNNGGNAQISSSYGNAYVFRHNIMGSVWGDGFDAHGNYNCLQNPANPESWGTCWVEIYGNQFSGPAGRMAMMRGGTCLIYSNSITGGVGDSMQVVLEEEETYEFGLAAGCQDPPGTWPYCEQITNSFFWGNTLNGSANTNVILDNLTTAANPNAILEGRDYWTHAPNATNVLVAYAPLAFPHPRITLEDGPLGPVFPPGTLNVSTLNVGTVKRP